MTTERTEPVVGETSAQFCKITAVERAVLQGVSMGRTVEFVRDHCDIEISAKEVVGLTKEAKKRLRDRFEKDFETDYQFVKENLYRIISEAIETGDHKIQLRAIQYFARIAGIMDSQVKAVLKIDRDSTQEFANLF